MEKDERIADDIKSDQPGFAAKVLSDAKKLLIGAILASTLWGVGAINQNETIEAQNATIKTQSVEIDDLKKENIFEKATKNHFIEAYHRSRFRESLKEEATRELLLQKAANLGFSKKLAEYTVEDIIKDMQHATFELSEKNGGFPRIDKEAAGKSLVTGANNKLNKPTEMKSKMKAEENDRVPYTPDVFR